MNCCKCGKPIPEERLAILPNTRVCVACSQEKPRKGFMVFSHKTAPELVTVDADDKESLRIVEKNKHHLRS